MIRTVEEWVAIFNDPAHVGNPATYQSVAKRILDDLVYYAGKDSSKDDDRKQLGNAIEAVVVLGLLWKEQQK